MLFCIGSLVASLTIAVAKPRSLGVLEDALVTYLLISFCKPTSDKTLEPLRRILATVVVEVLLSSVLHRSSGVTALSSEALLPPTASFLFPVTARRMPLELHRFLLFWDSAMVRRPLLKYKTGSE